VQITGGVKPFDNGQGYTLEVVRVEKARELPPNASSAEVTAFDKAPADHRGSHQDNTNA
jgi:hypothetical protein